MTGPISGQVIRYVYSGQVTRYVMFNRKTLCYVYKKEISVPSLWGTSDPNSFK